ncbi:MAG TPA: hypothetical protein VMG59_07690 [Phycisphaerae bacterium]|nr:hypothetical protein [Phycisphaerae bacterium]
MWMTILAVLIGGILATASGFITQLWLFHQERKAIAHALAGEINAILNIVRRRGYLEAFHELIEKVKQTQKPSKIVIQVKMEYFNVYKSNTDKIGRLPQKLTQRLVNFYTVAFSMIEDVLPESRHPKTVEESLRILEALRDMGKLLVEDGTLLVEELQRV